MTTHSPDAATNATDSPVGCPRYRAHLTAPLMLGLAGLLVTMATGLSATVAPHAGFTADRLTPLLLLSAGVIGATLLRALRRKLGLGAVTLHQAFSFDLLFQGAHLLHPQLPYPSVEREFLRRETGLPADAIAAWLPVRATSAAMVTLTLAGLVAELAEYRFISALTLAAAVGVLFRGLRVRNLDAGTRARHAAALTAGTLAVVLEGLLFVVAARCLEPQCPNWAAMLSYLVTLLVFELTPVPMALGVLELACGAMHLVPGLPVPGLFLPLAYRFCRGGLVIATTGFYLARYKLSLLDIYDVDLDRSLAATRRPPNGWSESSETNGPRLSIVIPAYNEAERLPRYLPETVAYAEGVDGGAEVLVVDDGSRDDTVAYAESVAASHPSVRVLRQVRNQGKGAAVLRGLRSARGQYILFADADGATPIREADKLLRVGMQGVEIVIGSRKAIDDSVQRDRSFVRDLMGAVFYRVTNLLAVPGVRDTQCGFKLFRRVAAQRLISLMHETGWAFDVELLFLAQKCGFAIVEVPVNWTAIAGSKVNPIKDAFKMFLAVLRIRQRGAGLGAIAQTLEATPS